MLRWDAEGRLEGVAFTIVDQRYGGIVPVRLDAPTAEIETILEASRLFRNPTIRETQAQRIAWRHLRDLVEQLLMAVRVGLYSVAEAFMANVVIETDEGSETMGQYVSRMKPQLGSEGLRLLGPSQTG